MKKLLDLTKKIAMIWHKDQYLKYEYLAEGCINRKIKKELEAKKVYHYQKYTEKSLNVPESVLNV